MKLSTQTILNLIGALHSFDGLDATRPGEKPMEPHKLSAKTRMTLAKNLVKLKDVETAYQQAREGSRLLHSEHGKMESDPQAIARFVSDNTAFLAYLHEVELATISQDELALEKNQIPVSVLANLAPMVTGMKDEAMEVRFPEPTRCEAAAAPHLNGISDQPASESSAAGALAG